MPVSVLVFEVGVLVVHLRQFRKFSMVFFVGLRSVGGLQFASGWLVFCFFFFVLVCFLFIASGWLVCALLTQISLVLFHLPVGGLRVASGWLTQISLVLFASGWLARSQ